MNFKTIFKIISKFFLSFIFGLLVALFVFKNDQFVRKKITQRLQPLLSFLLESNVSFAVERIDLFPLQITLKNVHTDCPKDDSWFWKADTFTFGCSWVDLLLYGTVSMQLGLYDVTAKTALTENGLSIWKHIRQLYEGEVAIPIFLQRLQIKNMQLDISEKNSGADVTTCFSLDLGTVGNALKGTVYLQDGSVCVQGLQLVENLGGSARFDVLGAADSFKLMIRPQCTLSVVQMGEKKQCSLSGLWKYDNGLFSLHNDDRSFLFGPIKLYLMGSTLFCELAGRFPASYLGSMFMKKEWTQQLAGECTVQMNIDFQNSMPSVCGQITSGPLLYDDRVLLSASKVSCVRKKDGWGGSLFFACQKGNVVLGQYRWDEKTSLGNLFFKNRSVFPLFTNSYWEILPEDISGECTYKNGVVTGAWRCVATHQKIGTQQICDGTVALQDSTVSVDGVVDDKTFCAQCDLLPTFCLQQCSCCNKNGDSLVAFQSHEKAPEKIVGTVSFSLIREFVNKVTGSALTGDGTFHVAGRYEHGSFIGNLRMRDGNVRIENFYNFLRQMYANILFDPFANKLVVEDFVCLFHRGRVRSPRVVVHFDKQFVPTFVHAPVLFRNCLLNWKKDLFAVASGAVTMHKKKNETPFVKGSVCVERSQLSQNIFSPEFQKNFWRGSNSLEASSLEADTLDCGFDLRIKTKEPVHVRTSFLQTSVLLDLVLGGTTKKPDVTGSVSLSSGSLAFPYKPLLLTKGTIEFVSGDLDNPSLEIYAKNKIKKYNVGLHVTGTLKEQHISLQASPPLSEEQILSLLLAGSEHESLHILMPALIMQNVKGILFGFDHSQTGVQSAFAKLFKPLKKIHLVPSFTDQTGRGGFRGAVEIDINERWRAMIQKNFALTEDTKVEAEYLLSDDISLRGVRDERGDVSAEVEMRWKF